MKRSSNIGNEIKRLLSEAIEKAVQHCIDEAMAMEPLTTYSSPERGFDPNNTVEGSLVEPITDEKRLIE